MSDLIDRQAAIDKFKPWLEVRNYGWGELNMLRAVINELENLPPVQPNHNADVSKKEIVQCKDCKFAHMTVDGECKYCDIWFPDEKTYMPGDYYCASAERRGDPDDND